MQKSGNRVSLPLRNVRFSKEPRPVALSGQHVVSHVHMLHSLPLGPAATQSSAETPVARQPAARKEARESAVSCLRPRTPRPKGKIRPPWSWDPAYRSRPGSGHRAIVAHPLGKRLRHRGTLHVFSTGEDCLHCGQ